MTKLLWKVASPTNPTKNTAKAATNTVSSRYSAVNAGCVEVFVFAFHSVRSNSSDYPLRIFSQLHRVEWFEGWSDKTWILLSPFQRNIPKGYKSFQKALCFPWCLSFPFYCRRRLVRDVVHYSGDFRNFVSYPC